MSSLCSVLNPLGTLAVLALACPADSQDIVWSRAGTREFVRPLGWPVELSDLDGDGFNEFVLRSYFSCRPLGDINRMSATYENAVILCGIDGTFLRGQCAQAPIDPWIWGPFPAGDFDGDGVRDFSRVVWDRRDIYYQSVEVVSGRSGLLLLKIANTWRNRESDFFFATADIDLTGDGRNDLVVGIRSSPGRKDRVAAYDHEGCHLYDIHPFWMTSPPAGLQDIDGDGCMEILATGVTSPVGGFVHVYSGRTGALIRASAGLQNTDFARTDGCTVKPCGDIDRDGIEDYAASSVAQQTPQLGVAMIWSGRTGNVLRTWQEPYSEPMGGRMSVCDADGDGINDVVVRYGSIPGLTSRTSNELRCLSGRDGGLIATLIADNQHPPVFSNVGMAAFPFTTGAPRGDDVFPVVVAAEPNYGYGTLSQWSAFTSLGRTIMFRTAPPGVRGYGQGCAGGLPKQPGIGWRAYSPTQARVHLTDAPSGASAYLFVGFSDSNFGPRTLPLDLAPFGFSGCSLLCSVDLIVAARAGSIGIDRGYAYADVPRGPVTLFAQWAVFDPTSRAVGFSKGMRW